MLKVRDVTIVKGDLRHDPAICSLAQSREQIQVLFKFSIFNNIRVFAAIRTQFMIKKIESALEGILLFFRYSLNAQGWLSFYLASANSSG